VILAENGFDFDVMIKGRRREKFLVSDSYKNPLML